MKRVGLIIAAMIVLFMSLQINAQPTRPKGTPDEIAKKQGDEIQKNLGLTDDEKTKFVAARTTQLTKLQGLERHSPESKATRQAAATDFEASVKAAFTPEHFTAWQKAKEEMKKNRQDRKGKRGGSLGQASDDEKGDMD